MDCVDSDAGAQLVVTNFLFADSQCRTGYIKNTDMICALSKEDIMDVAEFECTAGKKGLVRRIVTKPNKLQKCKDLEKAVASMNKETAKCKKGSDKFQDAAIKGKAGLRVYQNAVVACQDTDAGRVMTATHRLFSDDKCTAGFGMNSEKMCAIAKEKSGKMGTTFRCEGTQRGVVAVGSTPAEKGQTCDKEGLAKANEQLAKCIQSAEEYQVRGKPDKPSSSPSSGPGGDDAGSIFFKPSLIGCGCDDDSNCGVGGHFQIFADKDCSKDFGSQSKAIADQMCAGIGKNGCHAVIGEDKLALGLLSDMLNDDNVDAICKDTGVQKLVEMAKQMEGKCINLTQLTGLANAATQQGQRIAEKMGAGEDGQRRTADAGDGNGAASSANQKKEKSGAVRLFSLATFALAALALF